jgi:hypothetical protein
MARLVPKYPTLVQFCICISLTSGELLPLPIDCIADTPRSCVRGLVSTILLVL